MSVEELPADQELVSRYRQCRDEAAFEALVRRHGPLVLGVCRRVTGHHHDAEEAFQATFLVLARKAAAGLAPEALPNWLYGVAYRTALKLRSAIARRRAKEVQVTMVLDPEAPAADGWSDIAPILDRELNQLPGKYQAAIVCCDLKGMSREVAARELGWPEGTLKVRLMRGRTILAKRLARQGVVLSAGALAVAVAQNAASAAVPTALVASTVHAAGALAATQAVTTAAVGTKAVTVAKTSAKALLKPLLFGKVTVATSVGGVALAVVTATAAVFVSAEPKSPPPTQEIRLPVEIEEALRENGEQLSPITVATKTHIESKLPQDEAIKRLNMSDAPNPKVLFAERTCRTILQDHKLYVANSLFGETVDKKPIEGVSEVVIDGRFSLRGNRTNLPKSNAFLMKEFASTVFERMPEAFTAISPYFQMTASFALSSTVRAGAGAKGAEYRVNAESAVLAHLRKGGKLVSVENVTLDGHKAVRVELEVPNPIRKGAELIDINQLRENQKHSKASPKWQEQVLQGVLAQRKLPATCRYAYYLDPALHYAVRRLDRSYAPDTLLSRSISSDFVQEPGRPVWLPRRIETEMHEMPNQSTPDPVLVDSILSEVLEITTYDFARVPDDAFALNYTKPGTFVVDYTDATAKSSDGSIRYQIPERPQELTAVIQKARNAPQPMMLGGRPLAMAGPVQPRYRTKTLVMIGVANVAAIACGIAFVVWRRRKEGE